MKKISLCVVAVALTTTLSATESVPPLIAAVKRGDHATVHTLLRLGPGDSAKAVDRTEVNRPQADGTTALHWAVTYTGRSSSARTSATSPSKRSKRRVT